MDAGDIPADIERVLFTEEEVIARVAELALEVDDDYDGAPLLLVGVLKGAMMIMADLSRHIRTPVEVDWMAVSSYGSGAASSGVVRILKDLDTDITDRHVLIVEDVLDSGLTLRWLMRNLRARGPKSVELLTLLRKPEAVKNEVDARYVGFDIGDAYVVGYGMDYDQRFRNLRSIGVLTTSGRTK